MVSPEAPPPHVITGYKMLRVRHPPTCMCTHARPNAFSHKHAHLQAHTHNVTSMCTQCDISPPPPPPNTMWHPCAHSATYPPPPHTQCDIHVHTVWHIPPPNTMWHPCAHSVTYPPPPPPQHNVTSMCTQCDISPPPPPPQHNVTSMCTQCDIFPPPPPPNTMWHPCAHSVTYPPPTQCDIHVHTVWHIPPPPPPTQCDIHVHTVWHIPPPTQCDIPVHTVWHIPPPPPTQCDIPVHTVWHIPPPPTQCDIPVHTVWHPPPTHPHTQFDIRKHTVIPHLWLERWPSWEQCRRYPTPRPCRQGPVCSDTGTHTEAGLVVTALSLSERSCTESLSSVTWNRASQTAHTAYNTACTAYLRSTADTRIHVPDRQEDPGGEILWIHWTCALELPSSLSSIHLHSLFLSQNWIPISSPLLTVILPIHHQ